MGRRLLALYLGLVLFGVSIALLVVSGLGLDSWDVFHQGLAQRTGLGLGSIVILVGAIVLALWIPLRERPGIGTVSNVILVGLAIDGALAFLPEPSIVAWQVVFMVAGIVLNAVATALYIGAGLGPGPRDGLMTGLAKRGYSIRLVRTSIEVVVLVAGWLLGGTVGIGTVLYAVSIGPLVHFLLPLLTIVAGSHPEPRETSTAQAATTAHRERPVHD
ncbi:MAG: YczE/YyaS/YitT family protein [Actinomycetota bacterium]